jgi:hypothetical protein
MKIRPKTIDFRQLRLTAEEGFVLSRVDGPVSVRDLVTLTGLPEGRVEEIVNRLATEGALDVEGFVPPSGSAVAAAAKARVPSVPAPVETQPDLEEVPEEEATQSESAKADGAEDGEAALADEEPEPAAPVDQEEAAVVEEELQGERIWRKIYETVYRVMTRDQRLTAAKTVDGDHLMALCLDAEPQIIHALLDNPRFGLAEARYVAFHHRTQTGLEMLTRDASILKDSLVQRRLLRNPQLPDMILRKIVQPKLLTDTYKIAIDREVPERSRIKTAELLRRKFTTAGGEEKAALVIKTEGRCLTILSGCAFDAQTTQILCGRTSWTLMCVQNLARWSATPPQLLRTLLKQPIIRQNFGIRKMLLKHPNMPSDVKRAFSTGQ